jgi:hypothetical protein
VQRQHWLTLFNRLIFGAAEQTSGQKIFFSSRPGHRARGVSLDCRKTAAGGLLRAFRDANLPEGDILKIAFNCLTNSFQYYKVKTHTKGRPYNGLNMLNLFKK